MPLSVPMVTMLLRNGTPGRLLLSYGCATHLTWNRLLKYTLSRTKRLLLVYGVVSTTRSNGARDPSLSVGMATSQLYLMLVMLIPESAHMLRVRPYFG